MPTLYMTKGLPASGKSTWAKERVSIDGNTKRINKDDLRLMLDNGEWSKNNEKFVLEVRDTIASNALYRGFDVIIDDTNFDPKHEKSLRRIVESFEDPNYCFEEVFFDVPVDECIKRDAKREKPVGKEVIMRMYNQYLRTEPKVLEYDPALPECIICDIDGTLAKKGDRSHYDYTKVSGDKIIPHTRFIVNMFYSSKHVFLFSGREDSCREDTEQWLMNNNVNYTLLLMRKTGDKRRDDIVKKEMYEEYIKGKYNVRFVIDDRKRVKRMWVDEGLFVFDVNQTDEEF